MTATGVRSLGFLAWLHLMRVYDKMQRHSMDHLTAFGLTPAQFDVLAQIDANPGITQQALAEKLLVTKGNVCGLLDRLEAHGLVRRQIDPEDRRSNLLYLTDEGKKIGEAAFPAYEQFIRDHMQVLLPDEQRDLLRLLRDLDNSLDAHHP